jgi:ABC-2 type transport system ATP-binding protein
VSALPARLPRAGGGPELRPVPAPALVEVRGVRKRWRRAAEPVLRGVDLVLAPGQAVLVCGRNGAGKTTLLRVLSGLIGPDEGGVSIAGLDPERDRREYQRHVGLLAAGNGGLYARLSARRHLEYWARLALVPARRRRAAIEAALARFELEELAERRVDRLSMGQRQRVRLAMTFLHEPSVVLLDEPRTSLDEEGAELIVRALRDLLARGGAAVWCAPSGDPVPAEIGTRLRLAGGTLEPA